MAKSAHSGLKLLLIERLFYERTDNELGVTMGEILDYLSSCGIAAERKSIYSDIELLKSAGLDIELIRTDSRREYRLLTREFTPVEVKLLVDAVAASRFVTGQKSRELIGKLKRLVSVHGRAGLQSQIHVDNRIKSMNESVYYNADAIDSALSQNKKITFTYFDYTPEKRRKKRAGIYSASPLGLIVCAENYYLCAYSEAHGEIRNYRVDRMLEVSVSPEGRTDNELVRNFDISAYREKQFSMFGGRQSYVDIEFDNSLANVVLDYFGADVMMRPETESTFRVSRKIEVSPAFYGWLFQFGRSCRLISPADAREEYRALARLVSGI